MEKNTIVIAGKNDIATDMLKYTYDRFGKEYEIKVLCNSTENGIDSWQKSLRKMAISLNVIECKIDDIYHIKNLIFISLEYDSVVDPSKFMSNYLYNIHFALLPRYKGMYTSIMPIINGEKRGGVTLHRIEKGIDTGDIIDQIEFEISSADCASDLYMKYEQYAKILYMNNIDNIIAHKIVSRRQQASDSLYYSRKTIDFHNIIIDLNQTAVSISNQIRAFNFRHYQLPTVYHRRIIESKITDIKSIKKPGSIIFEDNHGMYLASIDYNVFLYFDRFGELLDACKCGNYDQVLDICISRRHINEKDEHGWTPLAVATYYSQLEIVKLLIELGADISCKNNNGTNLLMYAKEAYLHTGNGEIFNLYIELGLDISEKDYRDKSLIDYCRDAGVSTIGNTSLLVSTLL